MPTFATDLGTCLFVLKVPCCWLPCPTSAHI